MVRGWGELSRSERAYVLRHAVAQLLLWSAFFYLFAALLPRIGTALGETPILMSAALTGGLLVWALAAPFCGRLIDRGHGRGLLAGGALCGAAALVLIAAAPGFPVFAAGMLLLGPAMAATLYDPCFALVVRRFPNRARAPIAAVTLVAGLASLVTFPLAAVLGAVLDWRGIVLVFATAAVLAALVLPGEAEGVEARERAAAPPLAAGLRARTLLIGASFAALILSHSMLLFHLPAALAARPAFGASALLILALIGPAQIFGRLALGAMPGVSSALLCRVVFVFMLVPPLLLLAAPEFPALVLVAVLLQGAGFGIHTVLRPEAAERHLGSRAIGGALGVIAMIGLLMMALGPALGALAQARFGFSGLLWLALAVNAVGLVLLLRLDPPGIENTVTRRS
ncbi:MFS transporter [Nitratireductor alexandrii]|uniref:MFS transporter n=1 Tax=Nitratireductor alexandrii TaxID=2448161 RepID=UPI0013DFBDB2|nr:MFS transporter [Nitratireductor alexandrii]